MEANRTTSLDQKHKLPNTNYVPNLPPNPPLQKLPSPTITTSNETNMEYYPGPFSPQYFSQKGNKTAAHKPKPHHALTDLLSPFHLEEFAPEIDKELHANVTEPAKKGKKPTKGHNSKYEDDGEDNDESYDEKNQYEDLFTDIFNTKNNNKNNKHAAKHPFWTPMAPSKHGHQGTESSDDTKVQQQPVAKPTTKESQPSTANADSTTERAPTISTEEELDKPASDVIQGNPFLPYHPNIPYTMPNPIFSNLNPNLKHPPHEILIHQSHGAPTGFNHKFKPPTIGDPSQPEEFYHIVDNDAYNDEQQIRQQQQQQQNLHFSPGQSHGMHQQVIKLNKNGIRPPNQIVAGDQDIVNVEDVLTHLHNENANTNNNNIHLPNLLHGPEHSQIHHPVLNNHHNNYPFQNYPHETLNVDQTSHPLLLHPELVSHNGNDSNRGLCADNGRLILLYSFYILNSNFSLVSLPLLNEYTVVGIR